MLEELITNHQFGPKGFSLVPQGTPSNNTERNGTGYSDNDPYDDQAFFTDFQAPAFEPSAANPRRSQTDGRRLADAWGIGFEPLQTVQHADQTDVLDARAMNTALFPSTLGYWLKNWMSPVVSADVARLTRTFFTQYVSGRGPLPAIRVGNQPYGVLLTSDLSRWKYPRAQGFIEFALFDELTPFLGKLHALLLRLEKTWGGLAADAPFVGKPGSDSAKVLMKLLGLHPTSVELFQRIGFTSEYLHGMSSFLNGAKYEDELATLDESLPASLRGYLQSLGIATGLADAAKTLATHVLWQHYVAALEVPSWVENKPASELNPLTQNYVEWLAKAESTEKILAEAFAGPKPTSLLYVMLRNALLLQLHHGTYEWLKGRSDFEPQLERALVPTSLPGVRSSAVSVSRLELMAVSVEAAQPDHPAPATSVADWIWRGPAPAEVEAAFVKEQRAALEQLAPASTASLERCLAEHLDCCQYRLDAWITGLFAQRLQSQRRSGSEFEDRRTGIYLGAFGWVEDLKPTAKTFLRPEALPASLRAGAKGLVLEEDEVAAAGRTGPGSRQGGYTHAPSLNHAAAAALLRNAYLSHADRTQAEMMSINLSSSRVRHAQFVLEGMRNGQPIEALLGYQFERGLHDVTSESVARNDSPVLELNRFIAPYRQAFPFESREIAQAGTEAATETVPPNCVVNGLKLTTATLGLGDGFGLAAVLPKAALPDAQQGAVVLALCDGLRDTLDAVKDLLMAENAYQLVQGNFDRVAAVSLAQKDARIPPSLEVLNTPRGSTFTFTQRVTLHFDGLDPAVAESNPWRATAARPRAVPMTPRAWAEPGMNFWLGELLGSRPEQVRCLAYHVASANPDVRLAPHLVTLADLEIQPIDFVALIGINPADTHGATELETRVARSYRRAHGISPDQLVRIDFDPTLPSGVLGFGRLFPLARRLRGLLAECRALGAQDFLPAAGSKATATPVDTSNPGGYDLAELEARVESAFSALGALADLLDGPAAPTVTVVLLHDPETVVDDEPFVGGLGSVFSKMEQTSVDFEDRAASTVAFALVDAEALATTLRNVSNFGLSDAFPPEADFSSDRARRSLLSRAQRVARRLRNQRKDGVLDKAAESLAEASSDRSIAEQVASLLRAGRQLFSGTLGCLPSFTCFNEVDLATADAARTQLLSHALSRAPELAGTDVVDEWLHGLSRVRPRLHTLEVVRLLADALNETVMDLRPVQVPHRNQDSWLAVEFPKQDPLDPEKSFGISRDTLSICAHGDSAFKASVPQRGLLVDEWPEDIPSARENTGISFRFNQPNAVPPQAVLLAVTPEETGAWSWDDLVGTLSDTLGRAKRRAVEPADLEENGLVWNALAPALVSEFSASYQTDVSLDLMSIVEHAPLVSFHATHKA
jgi:hypothetical protein